MISIIFDLDQTLLDTSSAEEYRTARRWALAYAEIPNFKSYEGFSEVFAYLEENSINCCIVTNSPGSYCDKVTAHWNIKCSFHICYHDTKKRKPHPDPYLLALNKFDVQPEEVLAVGDRDIDITAAHAAGIKSVACLWGANDKKSLLATNPTYIAKYPKELLGIIKQLNS